MTTPVEIVARALRKNLLAPAPQDDDDLRADLRGNDLTILSALMDIEDALEVELEDHEIEGLRTVGDLHALVARKAGVEA